MPDTNGLTNLATPNEIMVGGVYLRIFIANPSWNLRKPKEFLTELLETCLNLMSKEKPNVSEYCNYIAVHESTIWIFFLNLKRCINIFIHIFKT